MQERSLGRTGPRVSAIGLGCMGMSDLYGPADEAEGIATIHAALDAGIDLLDTGDFYGMGTNELLIREALRGRDRDRVQISVKFGGMRDPAGNWLGYDGRPAAVKNFLAYSLRRLGTDHIDIYRLSRVDPAVPIEETVGAIAEMIAAGDVRHIGMSEAGSPRIPALGLDLDVRTDFPRSRPGQSRKNYWNPRPRWARPARPVESTLMPENWPTATPSWLRVLTEKAPAVCAVPVRSSETDCATPLELGV